VREPFRSDVCHRFGSLDQRGDSFFFSPEIRQICGDKRFPKAMTTSEQEIARLQVEVETQKKATTTKDACEEIVKFVSSKQDTDLLVNPSKENPYHQAPSSGGGCCILQ